jgi:hypothetical protein
MQSGKFGEGYDGIQELTGVADEVIKATKDLRANRFYGAKWLDNFFVIGDDGAGDYYFMNVERKTSTVFFCRPRIDNE